MGVVSCHPIGGLHFPAKKPSSNRRAPFSRHRLTGGFTPPPSPHTKPSSNRRVSPPSLRYRYGVDALIIVQDARGSPYLIRTGNNWNVSHYGVEGYSASGIGWEREVELYTTA
ncbi:hypothetical protein TNCT_454001 [Trichonephila clavata]|uniref:Uncharacterized protein n=1 Tax=Trichonephila clavata TaxID=2740835 RepID=A0A8X6L039_TRICU|nr:hypothetical protein TNCT_454001 [Trichonephila clavata]